MIIQQFSRVTALASAEKARRSFYYYGLQGERQERYGGSLYGKVGSTRNLVHVKWCRINGIQHCG
jgi:hypothetical protein